MDKPKLLDLFCCAGGAGMGYALAGFEITGVDLQPQPNNPHFFVQADAIEYLEKYGDKFDVIHASPPCQGYTKLKALNQDKEYPMLIEVVREKLKATGKPYIIENVIGAPLHSSTDLFGNHGVMLCGSMFGLGVWRHRIFESSFPIRQPLCQHSLVPKPLDVSGTGGPRKNCKRTDSAGGESRKPRSIKEAQYAMGIDWMTRKEINQAIPPAYTEFLGLQLRARPGFLT